MSAYIGRFAPSPTGPLHMGSLICALASYLDAKAQRGRWLLRIEDLDPPREIAGASKSFLRDLKQHGLAWDGDVMWQSRRTPQYEEALQNLCSKAKVYACDCSRQSLREFGAVYPGMCRQRGLLDAPGLALRIAVDQRELTFDDLIQGHQPQRLDRDVGDFIIRRKDMLFAYQLAVVVDDAAQGITHVLRGSDLLESTGRQLYLQQLLGDPSPAYAHIPVLLNAEGSKYSKQTMAAPVGGSDACENLLAALRFLQQPLPPTRLRQQVGSILDWAREHWQIQRIPTSLAVSDVVFST
ncbi:MAG: tRNA glutamyl-Q(34) synthetase GluQRS [Pseudomonadales bacterium]